MSLKLIADAVTKYEDTLLRTISYAQEELSKAAEDMEITLCDIDPKENEDPSTISSDPTLLKADRLYLTLLREEKKMQQEKNAFAEISQQLESGRMQLEDAKAYFDEKTTAIDEENIGNDLSEFKTSEAYRDFRSTIWTVRHPLKAFRGLDEEQDGDDDLVFVGQTLVTRCPITQMDLLEPFVSKCKHAFSHAIFDLISRSQTQQIPCPVAGCAAKLRREDLKIDLKMGGKIKRALEREKQAAINENAARIIEDL